MAQSAKRYVGEADRAQASERPLFNQDFETLKATLEKMESGEQNFVNFDTCNMGAGPGQVVRGRAASLWGGNSMETLCLLNWGGGKGGGDSGNSWANRLIGSLQIDSCRDSVLWGIDALV